MLIYGLKLPLLVARANLIKMHGREKEKIKFILKNAPSRISLTFDLWT